MSWPDLTAIRKGKLYVVVYVCLQPVLVSDRMEMLLSEGNRFKSLSLPLCSKMEKIEKKKIHQCNKIKDEGNCVWHPIKSLLDDVQSASLWEPVTVELNNSCAAVFWAESHRSSACAAVLGALLEVMKCTQRSKRRKIDYDFSVRAGKKKKKHIVSYSSLEPLYFQVRGSISSPGSQTLVHLVASLRDAAGAEKTAKYITVPLPSFSLSHQNRQVPHQGETGSIGLMDGACRRQRWAGGGGEEVAE